VSDGHSTLHYVSFDIAYLVYHIEKIQIPVQTSPIDTGKEWRLLILSGDGFNKTIASFYLEPGKMKYLLYQAADHGVLFMG
jgi:hypothetical protein